MVTPEMVIIAGHPVSMLITGSELPVGVTLTSTVGADRDTATPAMITALTVHQ